MPHDVVCLGEVMVELSLNDATPDLARVGYAGDTFNTCVYLKRRSPELSVAYATKLGTDKLSDRILDLMRSEEIATDLVLRSGQRLPGLYAISTDAQGERSFLYWRERAAVRTLFEAPSLDFSMLASTGMIYLSAITLAILTKNDRTRLLEGLAGLRSKGAKIAFDSNFRPALWPDKATAREEIERAWRMTDIGLPSIDDEMALFGDATEADVLDRFAKWGVTDGALKRGPKGAIHLDGSPSPECPPAPRVIDSTAAGDSFNAGYLSARLAGKDPSASLVAGHALAALVVQHRGAIVPRDVMGE